MIRSAGNGSFPTEEGSDRNRASQLPGAMRSDAKFGQPARIPRFIFRQMERMAREHGFQPGEPAQKNPKFS